MCLMTIKFHDIIIMQVQLYYYTLFICYTSCIYIVMWNIFIGVRYNTQQDYYWTSIVCHTVLNILSPVIGIVGVSLFLNVVTYISSGQINFQIIFSYLLASVKIVNVEMVHPPKLTFKFWVIADLFYVRLRTPQGNPKHLRYYIDRTPATYVLATLVCLAFTLGTWLFLEAILVKNLTVTTPVTDNDCSGYTCAYGLTPLSCHEVTQLNITDNMMLHCTLFHFESDILNFSYELVIAILVYIGAVQLLRITVFLVAILLLIYQTKFWGVLLLICHILLFIVILVIAVTAQSINVPDRPKLVAVPLLFIPMDLLLLFGGVREVIQEPQRTRCIIVKPKHYFKGLHHMNSLTDS